MAQTSVTVSLEMPTLAGSRIRAQQLLNQLPQDLSGQVVELQCGLLIAAVVSFADEIVRTVLVDRHAERLEVTRVSDRYFVEHLRDCAVEYHAADRLHISA